MTRLRLFVLTLALGAPVLAQQAPAAADAYARAAGLFIDGEAEQAEAIAEAGLQQAPDDAKLQALLDLIRQQQPPQDGDGNDPNDEGESSPDQQDENGEGGGNSPQDGPEDGGQEAEQDQTRTDPQDGEGEDESDRQPEGARPGEGGETPDGEAPATPQRMSAEQAGQILDAVGGEERLLLRELRRRPTRMRRSDKDW